MKDYGLYSLFILSFLFFLSSPAIAGETIEQNFINNVQEVTELQKELKSTGTIPSPCPACDEQQPDHKILLNSKTIDLEKSLTFLKENKPVIVHLERTPDSPDEVDIKFKNSSQYCGKMYVGSNPFAHSNIIIDCQFYLTRYEDEVITVNLKNLLPVSEKKEILVLKLTKKSFKTGKYELVAEHNFPEVKVEQKKKFFGGGINLTFRSEK